MSLKNTKEYQRLQEDKQRKAYWRRWGPYLAERQWATVREDYSPDGNAWDYFPHTQARSRAYRWGEDGLGGISDNHQRLCFAIALWNTRDPILKERLFGLTNSEGNHGEDVKEYYFYLDSTPTHSYMKYLYKYPQSSYPYELLRTQNARQSRRKSEYELLDTGIFDEEQYFDVFLEYAKQTDEDILIRIQIINRGYLPAPIHIIPQLWFRNTWSWKTEAIKPELKQTTETCIKASHPSLGDREWYFEKPNAILFTENETNYQRLFHIPNQSPYVKDAFHEYIIHQKPDAINPHPSGTKAGLHFHFTLQPQESKIIHLRLTNILDLSAPFKEVNALFETRRCEANEFYTWFTTSTSQELQQIQRQAFSSLLWTKQWYHYVVEEWLTGDEVGPVPPTQRLTGRNHDWIHLYTDDILSMPDKWEYPWFAAWDTAFHLIPLTMIDPDFAKRQLTLLTREWYMHPNGQIPAYEWNFEDVNPPVHAWAAWRIYELENAIYGVKDHQFLERVFQKLLLNFTWWVNQKDKEGKNIFQGGFLGLDNIGVFDRSGSHLEEDFPFSSLDQADGTAWMSMYCLNMLRIALELAQTNPAYEDIASKFFEHFLYIANAMDQVGLWNSEDQFYYDIIHQPNGEHFPVQIRSIVGLIPLFSVEVIDQQLLNKVPNFVRRMKWFMTNRPDLSHNVICQLDHQRHIFSLVKIDHLTSILPCVFNSSEFLSTYGIRSLSKRHLTHPFILQMGKHRHVVTYEPAESTSVAFGGNSNWRGPIWFPINFLLIETLHKFHKYLGDDYQIDFPSKSGHQMTLHEVATQLSQRLINLFLPDQKGTRPCHGDQIQFQRDPYWRQHLLFYEYFHGDTGKGLGASHQTGWTSLIAALIHQVNIKSESNATESLSLN
jgi:hypothetical protein